MMAYIFQTILCMSILLGIYHTLLKKERMFKFNRFFLLFALMLSMVIPFVTISVEVDALPTIGELPVIYSTQIPTDISTEGIAVAEPTAESGFSLSIPLLLLLIYVTISALLIIRFIYGIVAIGFAIKRNKLVEYKNNIKIVSTKETIVPYSFFNYIFVNENDLEKEILIHESTHARQKHSADVLFIELLIAIFWFNPALYLYRKAMKLNHEFLADESVVDMIDNVSAYQLMLIEKAGKGKNLSLACNLNYLITKKRLIMMTKKTSGAISVFKKTLALAICSITAIAFCIETTAAPSAVNVDKELLETETLTIAEMPIDIQSDGNQKPQFTKPVMRYAPPRNMYSGSTKDGVSQNLLNEYGTIVKKYTDKYKGQKNVENNISTDDKERLENIFRQMNRNQQAAQLIVFVNPENVIARSEVTKEEVKQWVNDGKCTVLIDNKKINKSELNGYSLSDIATSDITSSTSSTMVYLSTNSYYASHYTEPTASTPTRLVYVMLGE